VFGRRVGSATVTPFDKAHESGGVMVFKFARHRGVTSGSENAGRTLERRSFGHRGVWHLGRPSEAAAGRARRRLERTARLPRLPAVMRIDWRTALVSLTL